MARSYLYVLSMDHCTAADTDRTFELAAQTASRHATVIFLTQNAVLMSRPGALLGMLMEAIRAGVEVWVDRFSLSERGIDLDCVRSGFQPRSMDDVASRLDDGARVIWAG